MAVRFLPGFTVFESGDGPAWVAPHAGPGFRFPDSRDEMTDVIAGICWEKCGGKLIVSNASRIRDFGVDFNRAPPSLREAVGMNGILRGGRIDQDAYYEYKRKYAWTAAGRKDHEARLSIYNSFWKEAGGPDAAVIIHRMFTTPKTAGSLMDIFTPGFDESSLKTAVSEMNKKYGGFFRGIKKDFTDYMTLKEKRVIYFVKRTPPEDIEKEFVYNLRDHMDVMGVKSLDGIIPAIGKYMRGVEPAITVRKMFSGSVSHGLKNLPKGRKVIQAEVTSFMGSWYPDVAAGIICEIYESLRGGRA
jgi:hypothetical protein